MNDQILPMDVSKNEFVLRRLTENCPDWTIGIPVAFAYAVLLLIVLFRSERRWAGMLWPFVAVTVAAPFYAWLALLFKPLLSWLVVIGPLLTVALFYVGAMYLKDARSIHPLWASFLGVLRCLVYAILTVVFFLPSCQTFKDNVTESKVVILLDVSGSLLTRDDTPDIDQDPAKLPTRQDKIIDFLARNSVDKRGVEQVAFINRVLEKSPVTLYRFGSVLDETAIHELSLARKKTFTVEDWQKFLKPDAKDIVVPDTITKEEERVAHKIKMQDLIESLQSGTNIGGSALQALKLENNSFIQAILVFSDGRDNFGSDEAKQEFVNRVTNPRRAIPVFTVAVGHYRQPAEIQIGDLHLPEVTRPDDKFPGRINVRGPGLNDEEFTVTVEVTRIKDGTGQPVVGEPTHKLPVMKGQFKGAGDNPQDLVPFEIDVQDLKKIKAGDERAAELEGTWRIVARVPRNPKEAFAKAEHVSEPVDVLVQKKKLRVLLFTGGPTREYQFVRTLFYREVIEKRAELTVLLQTGNEEHVDQDVEKDRMISKFPDRVGPVPVGQERFSSLSEFDVVVAIDPDWTALTTAQLKNLKDWVGDHAGGVIFVAGPVHSFHLARPGGRDLTSLMTIFPVVLKDSRLHGIGLAEVGVGHDTSRPYALNFPANAKNFDFLKLDETIDSPTAGWSGFFWGTDKVPEGSKDLRPKRGIFNYYPVDRIRPGSQVAATFAGPPASRINDGKDEQPFIVTMPYGGGKTMYIGSGEFWRLRQFKTGFHERLWIKSARYVATGSTMQKKYGVIPLARSMPAGNIAFEAQIKGSNLLPLPQDAKPTVYFKRISDKDAKSEAFDLRAKPFDGEWRGWFMGNIRIREAGDYEFRIPVPGTNEVLTHRMTIRKPNPETDNVRTDYGNLFQLATEASPILKPLPPEVQKEVEAVLKSASQEYRSQIQTPGAEGAKESERLFFPLASAHAIDKCLKQEKNKTESVKGPLFDLWDKGAETGWTVSAYHLLWATPLAIGLFAAAIFLVMKQHVIAAIFFGVCALFSLAVVFIDLSMTDTVWAMLPINFSFVLVAVVSLLVTEWLTRKLLRLA